MSTLGRATQEAGQRAEALLEVLDEATRPRVTEGAFDEIFVGRTPILMGVEPESLCWVRGCWRASSLVEGINSVVRMQQARHRKLTPGLLSLKRLYWNCRRFRTGRRRGRSPYELLGVAMPPGSWWKLLKMTPDQLRQELSTLQVAP